MEALFQVSIKRRYENFPYLYRLSAIYARRLVVKQLLATMLRTLACLYYYNFSEGENCQQVSVFVGMALQSEKHQNSTMSVVQLLVLSALKG